MEVPVSGRSYAQGPAVAQQRPMTLTDELCNQLSNLNDRLSMLVNKQNNFVHRMLPPEPRDAGEVSNPNKPLPDVATYRLQDLLTSARALTSELEYLAERMERIA